MEALFGIYIYIISRAVVTHAINPGTGEAEAGEAMSLDYKVSFRTARDHTEKHYVNIPPHSNSLPKISDPAM